MPFRLAACVAACVAAGAGAAHADTVPAPCVATGLFATIAPLGTTPVPVGPSLAAADRQGTSADAFSDERTSSSVDHVDLGAAGCRDAAGTPGGTALMATAWSVLGGALTGTGLTADLVPQPGDGSGWRLRAHVDGLVSELGDWGVLERQATVTAGATWWRAALELRLTRAHGGFAAGTRFLVGWASADREPAPVPVPPPPPKPKPKPKPAPKPVTTTTAPTTTTTATPAPKPKPKPHVKKKKKHKPKPKPKRGYHPSRKPLRTTPPLGPGTYDFPVFGAVDWGDSYGGARSDVPGGWHHGDDLFAPLGRPVVAVADGTVFAVGWNRVGGWRLWLRDRSGDAFYYAHLAGYTRLARNNNHVRRGDVLGFVGNTGDAFTTLPHLHFEVHPNELLYLGYDGAVDPTTYLAAWHHAEQVAKLPPVKLPTDHGRGLGSLTDYRRLLALQPLKRRPVTKDAAPQVEHPAALAAGLPRTEHTHGDGWGAAAAALALLGAALVAVAVTARRGAQVR